MQSAPTLSPASAVEHPETGPPRGPRADLAAALASADPIPSRATFSPPLGGSDYRAWKDRRRFEGVMADLGRAFENPPVPLFPPCEDCGTLDHLRHGWIGDRSGGRCALCWATDQDALVVASDHEAEAVAETRSKEGQRIVKVVQHTYQRETRGFSAETQWPVSVGEIVRLHYGSKLGRPMEVTDVDPAGRAYFRKWTRAA